MVRKGGTANLFGGCASGTSITVDTRAIHYSEVKIQGVFHHTPEHVRRALDLHGVLTPGIARLHAAQQNAVVARDGRQEVVEVVGDAAREAPNGFHLLRLTERLLAL